jgi:hypothetical protein
MLLLLSLTLPLNLTVISAAVSNDTSTADITNQSSIQNASGTTSSTSNSLGKVNTQSSVTTVSTTTTSASFTLSQINYAASRVKAFFDKNQRLPGYVTISNLQVSMPQFLQLLNEDLLKVSSGSKTAVTLKTVKTPASPVENISSGNISRTEYISLAKTMKTFIDSNGVAPNYVKTSLGKIGYESLVYTYSKVMNFYSTNSKLPNYVSVKPWNTYGSTNQDVWVYLSGLTYYKQPNSYSCGPSSLKMAFSVYGLNLNETWLEKMAWTTSTNGTSHAGILNAVKSVNAKYGTSASAWDTSLSSVGWTGLQKYLSNNNPVILHVKSWLSSGGHYVVLFGLNLGQGLAKLADPSYGGYRTVSLTELEQRMQWVVDTGRSSEPIIPIVNS